MPELVSAYGSEENAINHLTDALKNYIKAQQEAEQNNKNLAHFIVALVLFVLILVLFILAIIFFERVLTK